MKTCKVCQQEKPFEMFGIQKRPNNRTYYRSECRKCCTDKLKEYKNSPEGKDNHRERMRKKMANRKLLADAALEAIKAGILKDPRC